MTAPMDRPAERQRLSSDRLDTSDPFYLHYLYLFGFLRTASESASGRMLDIGCGNKPYASMFAGRVTEHFGCDVVQSSEHKVDLICPATEIPLPDGRFDTVLCTQVLEHVADHGALIREAFRLLEPGGHVILSAPMYWPLHEVPYDFFRFTQFGLRYLLEGAGFELVWLRSNGGKWATLGQAVIHTLEGGVWDRAWLRRVVNHGFSWLDRRWHDERNPMNYVVVARRPAATLTATAPA